MLQTRRLLILAAAFSLLAFFGCGSGKKGVELQGKLILPGNIHLGEQGSGTLNFMPEKPDAQAVSGKYNVKDQTFVVNTAQGKSVSPGKYKVTVQLDAYPGSKEAETQAETLKTINERYNLKNSPLSYEVTNDPKQAITIDLNKGTIQKN